MNSYEELLALLPDNVTGQIDASDIREIVRRVTPAYFSSYSQTAQDLTVSDVPTEFELVPMDNPLMSAGEWATLVQDNGDVNYVAPDIRRADIRFVAEVDQQGVRFDIVVVRDVTVITLCQTTGDGWAVTEIHPGDTIQVRAFWTGAVPGPGTVSLIRYQFDVTANLQKPSEVIDTL